MSTVANIVWIILGGVFTALWWCVAGVLCYVTIIGIPLGRQAFKMAALTLAPFGKTVVYGGGAPSLVANVIWLVIAGIPMALYYVCAGALFCVTVIGLPPGIQLFKMAKLSLLPFGAVVR